MVICGWVGGWGGPHLVPKICPGLQTERERVCCSACVSIPIYMNTSTLPTGTCHSKGLIQSTKDRECKSSGLLLNLNFCYVYIGCVITFLSLNLQPPGPSSSSSPSSIKRHGSACNPASNGVSTKLILSNPRGVNPYAYGKRGSGEDAGVGWWLTPGCYMLPENTHPSSPPSVSRRSSLSHELWAQSLLILISTANGASLHK